MLKRIFLKLIVTFIFTANIGTALHSQTKITSAMFGALTARQIGPAIMSGRITAIDAVNKESRIMYVGTADGGVWKSITGGTMFKPVFDKYSQSIGAVTIDQKKPNIVWVGTGESNMRNSVSIGTGLYKSEDAGETWQKVGLDSTEHIAKIVIDPRNDKIVYVAAPGPLWSDSKHRGLYKTTDGGKTWDIILYVNETTGCGDVAVDPKNPKIIYANMWEFRRKPWSFSSGGPGSGLFKSKDAGKTWERIDKDFSEGDLGRIAIAISPSDPDNIYVIAESNKTGLFNSVDGGETWTRNSTSGNVNARPFYFSVLMVDPSDSRRIYRPAFSLSISDDGGQSFREASFEGGWVHSDHHALWIDRVNPQHLYLGTDGGVYVSFDRGNNWLFLANLPVAQYYHIAFDYEKPYNIYGGLQDNGSWVGPSRSPGGIKNKDWTSIGFGDGFSVIPDLTDKNIIYWEYQGGNINRFNKITNESKDIQPYPLKNELKLRFNWNTPIYQSPNDNRAFYIGAQFLYRTTNKGDTWDRISPDLTTNDQAKLQQDLSGGLSIDNSSAENHCTIYAINESPLDPKMIWVGTDDGNLQLTLDGGNSWNNLVRNVPNLPANTWCSSVEASRYDRNIAYATFDGHALGDMRTYIYKTTDLGSTWVSLSTPDLFGYAHKIKEDIVNRNLLFLGTELGLFISIDGGKEWVRYDANVPEVAVRDIAIQPETNDLLLATHGRGVLILDDITPIRYLSNEMLDSDAVMLPVRTNYLNSGSLGGSYPPEAGFYVGPNPTDEAVIIYYLKERAVIGDLKLEIYDSEGKLIQTIQGTKRKGINRVTWDMRMKPPRVATGVRLDFGGFTSALVPEGTYTVKLIKGDRTIESKLELYSEPGSPFTKEERELQYKAMMELYRMEEDLAFLVDQVITLKDEADKLLQSGNTGGNLENALRDLMTRLEIHRQSLVASREGPGITGEEKLREKISGVFGSIASYSGRPTDSQLDRINTLEFELKNAGENSQEIFRKELSRVNTLLQNTKMKSFEPLTREQWDKTEVKK